MKYKTGVSLFRSRYERLENKPKMTDYEILAELSVAQQNIGNELRLPKSSRDNATAQLTVNITNSVYSTGTGAGNVPTDIEHIIAIFLNDDVRREVKPVSVSKMRGYQIYSAIPTFYTYYEVMGVGHKLEFDTKPDSAYLVDIRYIPKLELFVPSDTDNTTWSDFDETASDYGGKFKIPTVWENAMVLGALGLATLDANILGLYEAEVERLKLKAPIVASGKIPFDDGTQSGDMIVLQAGQDRVQRRS